MARKHRWHGVGEPTRPESLAGCHHRETACRSSQGTRVSLTPIGTCRRCGNTAYFLATKSEAKRWCQACGTSGPEVVITSDGDTYTDYQVMEIGEEQIPLADDEEEKTIKEERTDVEEMRHAANP